MYQWNGIGLFLPPLWETSDTLPLYTDASGSLGYVFFFQKRWFQGQWLPSRQLGQPGVSILWPELYAINVACHLWTYGHPSASSSIAIIRMWLRSLILVYPKFPA